MKLAVCDDEKNIREYIAERIRAADGDMQIVQYETAADILASGLSMDILFLDIQLPDSSGLEAARKLRERGSRAILVFVTAAEEYVFDAFDVNALGYIVKPFEEKKLDEVIVKAIDAAKKVSEAIGEMTGLGNIDLRESNIVTNERHVHMLRNAVMNLDEAISMLQNGEPVEVAELSAHYAYDALGRIIGEDVGDEILDTVFSKFCLGK